MRRRATSKVVSRRRATHRLRSLARLKVLVSLGFGAAMLIAGIVLFLVRPGTSFNLELPFVGKFDVTAPAQAAVSHKTVVTVSPKDNYRDARARFTFKRLPPPEWLPASTAHGIAGAARVQGVTVNGKPLAPTAAQLDRLPGGLATLGRLLKNEDVVYIAHRGGTSVTQGPVNIFLTNYFAVETLSRADAPGVSLSEFVGDFMFYLGAEGVKVEQLTAKTGQVLMTGSVHIPSAVVGGKAESVDLEHAYYFVATRRNFFIVELVYTPQLNQGFQPLSELQQTLESFRAAGTAAA